MWHIGVTLSYMSCRRLRSLPVCFSLKSLIAIQVLLFTEYVKQNIFARETPPQLLENYTSYPKEAEKTNGRWAMIGMISLLGAYVTTGQIIPGIF